MRQADEGSPHVTDRLPSGPRRSRSVNSDLRQSRLLAILALAAFAGAVVSDATSGSFWGRHTMLAGLAASVIVVMLSVGVINEVLERRRRRRWTILAQYVLFELVRNARMIWLGVLEVAGTFDAEPTDTRSIDTAAEIIRDTARLTAAVQMIVRDTDRRNRFHREIAFLAEHADVVLGRWAAVMLNAEIYAEVIDRHVELAGDIAWISSLLDTSNPPADLRRRQRARSNPAVEIEANLGDDWLADRITVITQLAEALDRGTLELALRVVPVAWWQARLRTTVQSAF
jgi:hypothetical protein